MKQLIILLGLLSFSIFTTSPILASNNGIIEKLCSMDCKSEFRFFRRYAQQGSSLADLSLGVMFLRGQGTEVNIPTGKRYIIRAAKAGEPGAQYQLGYLFMYGIYMPQDLEKATNWFKRAVKSKVPGAQKKVDLIESMLSKEGIKNTREYFAKQAVVSPKALKKDNDKNMEVITVTFVASYKHILEAARAQTCNTKSPSCLQQWNFVNAPIIVLTQDKNQFL